MADEVSPQSAPANNPQVTSGGKNKWLILGLVLIVFVILGSGFFLINKMKSASPMVSASPSIVPGEAAPTSPPIVEATYTCQDKKTMKVTYDNTNHSATVVLSDGRTLNLTQQESGSGTQYANSDGTIVLANKGSSALLTENGKQTYQSCGSGT